MKTDDKIPPYIPPKQIGVNGYVSENLVAKEHEDALYEAAEDPNAIVTGWEELDYCKNCVHFGQIYTYNTCADKSIIELILNGMSTVSYCGWCRHFINKHTEKGKSFTYSKVKQQILTKLGFNQNKGK